MLFSSTIFIVWFLPTVLTLYYGLAGGKVARNVLLLFSSLFFYAWGEPWFVLVMMGSIVANYYFGLKIDQYRGHRLYSRIIIISMLGINLGIMYIFKYLMFIMFNVQSIFQLSYNVPTIALPIGISFFTFQGISYVLDIYRQAAQAQRNILNTALYIAFFPQLIAGPIVRYETVAHQIHFRKETFDDFSIGSCRFIIGLAKKVLLANPMALIADKAFGMQTGDLSVSFAWLGVVAYMFQIYFDFSGYSDMAIGLGRMFGFHFLENFNYPYISKSVTEFWRRWHISLSSWFRDYVYFPLGGSRVSTQTRMIFNLFIVWMLTGFWHGANWTFIVWGIYYFVLLSCEKISGYARKAQDGKSWIILGHFYLIFVTLCGWVLFRSPSLSQALDYYKVMFGVNSNILIDDITILYLSENYVYFIFAAFFFMPIAGHVNQVIDHIRDANSEALVLYARSATVLERVSSVTYPIMMFGLFIISLSYIVRGTYNPFIYFNF